MEQAATSPVHAALHGTPEQLSRSLARWSLRDTPQMGLTRESLARSSLASAATQPWTPQLEQFDGEKENVSRRSTTPTPRTRRPRRSGAGRVPLQDITEELRDPKSPKVPRRLSYSKLDRDP